MIILSVIIPIYNTEKYIIQCLESIYRQNIQNIEIICVNDGSTDNSLKILQEYQKKHPDLIIIDKKNEGSGVARNIAIKISRGEYVLFADSDDWYMDGAFEKLLKKMFKVKADILIFGALTFSKGKLRKGHYSISQKSYDGIFNLFKFPSTAWSKLYNNKFLKNNNIQFQDTKTGQDQSFFVKSMISTDKIAVLKENLYCYRKNRVGSVTSVKKKQDFSPIQVFYSVKFAIKDLNDDYKNFILKRYLKKAIFRLTKLEESLKTAYYAELTSLLRSSSIKWAKQIHIKPNDSYLLLKIKVFIAQVFHSYQAIKQ